MQVIPGLDEGLKTMSTGGVRRMYIPGELAFPKGLPAGEFAKDGVLGRLGWETCWYRWLSLPYGAACR